MTEPQSDVGLDPVAVGILWSRLIRVTDEQAAALMRTSFTPVVRDIGDLSAAVFDRAGRMLAQANTGTPGHINALATGMRHFLERFPESEIRPGDVLLTNDPWITTGQLNDLSVVTPVFVRDQLIGFVGNTCHAVDIGGIGLSANGREIYEEGLQIPITKLYDAGVPNAQLLELIEANVRSPREVLGDLHAQVSGNEVGAAQLVQYLQEFGLTDLEEVGDEILSRSESAMRRALASIPDGTYSQTCEVDGFGEVPVRIKVAVTIDGDAATVDFAGSSEQSERGWNVVLNYAAAYTHYALKCALAPDVPHNDGSFRPISVVAPEGTLFNPRYPAAVAARQIAGHFIPHVVFGALRDVLEDRVVAEGAGGLWVTTLRGLGRDRFVGICFSAGGMGARPDADGLSATAFPAGIAAAEVEVLEAEYPMLFRRKELRCDSGGPGRYRGGLGQTIEIDVLSGEPVALSIISERITRPAAGYAGGRPGAKGEVSTSPATDGDLKLGVRLPEGAAFRLELPGGGGYYDPLERPRERVAADLQDGLISPESAVLDYGWDPGEAAAFAGCQDPASSET